MEEHLKSVSQCVVWSWSARQATKNAFVDLPCHCASSPISSALSSGFFSAELCETQGLEQDMYSCILYVYNTSHGGSIVPGNALDSQC
jgi:hypothetical protein